MDSITDFLDLEDSNIIIKSTSISGTTKTLTIEIPPAPHFCPVCQHRMHSRGIRTRTVQHPILQDNYNVVLLLRQRRWKCTNPQCRYETNDQFNFVKPKRRTTDVMDMMIVSSFRDLFMPATAIARKFHTSDTHVIEVFNRFVKMPRLPLTEIISIDEVQIDMDEHCKYALVIQDFFTADPIDLLQSRRSDITEPYFASIDPQERNRVKYLITDMYAPYIGYIDKYFPNAVSVVDAFHVIKWILHLIDIYYRSLIKRKKARDKELYLKQHPDCNPDNVPFSNEVYILQKYRWLIFSNKDRITYHSDFHMDRRLHCLMNTFDYEDYLFTIDPRLRTLRDLKEKYISFNNTHAGNPSSARPALEELIKEYRRSGDSIFIRFADTLSTYQESIINSFVVVQKNGTGGIYSSRLSNGPIESINRVVKDMRRESRGYRNFEHFRTRFLYATRSRPVIDGTSSTAYSTYDNRDDFF